MRVGLLSPCAGVCPVGRMAGGCWRRRLARSAAEDEVSAVGRRGSGPAPHLLRLPALSGRHGRTPAAGFAWADAGRVCARGRSIGRLLSGRRSTRRRRCMWWPGTRRCRRRPARWRAGEAAWAGLAPGLGGRGRIVGPLYSRPHSLDRVYLLRRRLIDVPAVVQSIDESSAVAGDRDLALDGRQHLAAEPGAGRRSSRIDRQDHSGQARWRARSTAPSNASSSRPTCCPLTSSGVSVFNQKSGDFEFRPGPIAGPGRPGRRDQPRRPAHPIRPA